MGMNDPMRGELHPDEALKLVLENIPQPAQEILPVSESLGRYLGKELLATVDQPPFDKSAMDGYAYGEKGPNWSGFWKFSELIPAGRSDRVQLKAGECARIMTGAPLPKGTVAVQRREYAEESAEGIRFIREESTDNIIRRGENQRAGDPLLSPRMIQPQDIGVLASSGYASVPVARRSTVGIVSTGDELAECGEELRNGAVYDSNGPQLSAQAAVLGCDVRFYGIAKDNREQLRDLIGLSLSERDVTIVSGAVSLGDFDYVPETFAALGVQGVFHGLKMRPGKPTYYGRLGAKAVYGLPGNPVSTFVNFEILVKPHLLARMGARCAPQTLRLPLSDPIRRKGSDRIEYRPARLTTEAGAGSGPTGVCPFRYRGSSMISSLAETDCLVKMELGIESLQEGELVDVRLIRA